MSGQSCQIDVGCPRETILLPTCPSGIVTTPIDTILGHIQDWVGLTVVVRGELQALAGNIKLLDAGRSRWCEDYPTALGVVDGASASSPPSQLAFWDPRHPDRFACIGDPSLRCCPLPVHSGDVLVSGTVQRGHPPDAFDYGLVGARLCLVSSRDAPPQIRAAGDRCSYDGVLQPPDTTVTVTHTTCGCASGRVVCRPGSRGHCFFGGNWFPDGASVGIRGDECSGRKCSHGIWKEFDTGCGGFVVLSPVLFRPRSWRIAAAHEPPLEEALTFYSRNKHTDIVIIGRISTSEGKTARTVASRRTRQVRNWLIKRGIAPSRISLFVAPEGQSSEQGAVQIAPPEFLPADASVVDP